MTVDGGMDRLRFTLSLLSHLVAQSLPISPGWSKGPATRPGSQPCACSTSGFGATAAMALLDEGLQVTGDNKRVRWLCPGSHG
jgi:hypothetical protein